LQRSRKPRGSLDSIPTKFFGPVEENGRCDTDHFIVLPSDDDGYFIVRPVSR
jgi:hypothetical protein